MQTSSLCSINSSNFIHLAPSNSHSAQSAKLLNVAHFLWVYNASCTPGISLITFNYTLDLVFIKRTLKSLFQKTGHHGVQCRNQSVTHKPLNCVTQHDVCVSPIKTDKKVKMAEANQYNSAKANSRSCGKTRLINSLVNCNNGCRVDAFHSLPAWVKLPAQGDFQNKTRGERQPLSQCPRLCSPSVFQRKVCLTGIQACPLRPLVKRR